MKEPLHPIKPTPPQKPTEKKHKLTVIPIENSGFFHEYYDYNKKLEINIDLKSIVKVVIDILEKNPKSSLNTVDGVLRIVANLDIQHHVDFNDDPYGEYDSATMDICEQIDITRFEYENNYNYLIETDQYNKNMKIYEKKLEQYEIDMQKYEVELQKFFEFRELNKSKLKEIKEEELKLAELTKTMEEKIKKMKEELK